MPSYSIITFGCQMNAHDSERMHGVLQGAGYREAPELAEADVILLNTCSVREKAEHKLRSEVGRLAPLKLARREVVIGVTGCLAQQEGKKLLRQMPALDLVIGPDNIAELPALLAQVETGGLPVVRTVFDTESPQFLAAGAGAGPRAPSASSFVTIMKGCDERCSFCVVPYTRGPERYRPSDEIVAEVAVLVGRGVAEVTLLGQTVNSYRDPEQKLAAAEGADPGDPDESEFAALLRRIAAEVPALRRLRYTSPHPRHVTPSLIAAHRDLEVLAAHVHLPVQSGSDRVLKRMIRRYTRAEYVARASALRAARPGLTLSTDVIVGFPGETDEEAEATVSLIREVGFLGVFGFKYSQRPYTPALRLADDVPEAEKGRRLARVFEASEGLLLAHLPTLIGRTEQVLVEGRSKTGEGLLTGRTHRNEIVHITGAAGLDLVGQVVPVTIRLANKHSVEGDLTEAARSAARELPPGAAPATKKRALPIAPAATGGEPACEVLGVPLILPIGGKAPRIAASAYIADNATIIGDVEIGEQASVWFGCVLRGDVGPIRVGARSNIQDLSCVHLTEAMSSTIVGEDVTVGHGVLLHGCVVRDRALVGMGSVLLDNSELGEGSVLGAGSLLTPRTVIGPGQLALGRPAQVKRAVNEAEARLGIDGARHYVENARRYLAERAR